ncbi:MAG: Ig-like domain-containing protein, partial [Treponemataceae bacterium]|nr:Ig-like domain-containing protein [Treponemataceae bacterium]
PPPPNFLACSTDDGDGDGNEITDITLTGPSGSTTHSTIQAALDAITDSGDYTIKLPKGTYNENYLHYTGAATVKISGDTTEQYGADVIIIGHGENMTQERQRELLEFQGTGNLILENVSFVSDYSRKDHSGDVQAEVVGFDSTGYLAAYNCAFKSHQDTLRTTGKAWFYKCYVEGDVDFIWMEEKGIVALYEDCEIVSVYDEYATTHETKICAPRMSPASKAGKGVVIYNSRVREDENGAQQKTYLARTPWSSGVWNQVAYIKTTLSGIEAEPWFKTPCTADGIDRTIIGWKLCGESAASCGYAGNGDIVSSEDVASEFSGRRAILNRLYDTSAGKYKKDSETYWDIGALIAKTGWNVAADTSEELLDGETEAKITVYEFDKEISEYADLTAEGFAKENGKAHAQAKNAGSTLSFPVTGKAVVTVTGYYKGLGTIGATDQGNALFDFNNGSTSKMIEKSYIVYTGENTVTITAEAETYITKISVEYDDGLAFAPVETIAVSADGNVTSVAAKKTLQFSAALNPAKPTNDDILWSIVTGEDAATIDARSGLLTALAPSA